MTTTQTVDTIITPEAIRSLRNIIEAADAAHFERLRNAETEDDVKRALRESVTHYRNILHSLLTVLEVGRRVTWDGDRSLFFSGGAFVGAMIDHGNGHVTVHT